MKQRSLLDRFNEKVDRSAGNSSCHLWTAWRLPHGYGVISAGGRNGGHLLAHRVSWELANEPIPKGMWVLHRCDNPPCVNPDHLFLGTPRDNMQDMQRKGRRVSGDFKGDKNPHARLSEEDVQDIRRRYTGARGELTTLGREFGVYKTTILKIVRRESWAHLDAPAALASM